MVVSLGPGKFYGSSLPRPHIYTEVKFNDSRVDPPAPVLDPLISWAEEAHWSMGGLSFKRHRLQGRIEGSIEKLRAERERQMRKAKREAKGSPSGTTVKIDVGVKRLSSLSDSVSPPPAPMAGKRRRLFLVDGDEDGDQESVRRLPARKLGDDFERVASDNVKGERPVTPDVAKTGGAPASSVATRTRGRKSEEQNSKTDEVEVVEETRRSSPRSKNSKGNKSKSDADEVEVVEETRRPSPRVMISKENRTSEVDAARETRRTSPRGKGSEEKRNSPNSVISSSPRTSPRLSKLKSRRNNRAQTPELHFPSKQISNLKPQTTRNSFLPQGH